VIIPAIGQEPDLTCLDADLDACTACGMDIQRDSTMVVNRALSTTRKGIFAAGDVVLGPASVIEAVAQGNQVARSVDNYLRTGSIEKEVLLAGYEAIEQLYDLEEYAEARRPDMITLPIEQRKDSFDEVEQGLPAQAIREECKRCLRCDLEWLEVRALPQEPKPDRKARF
jgi:pyruvate/2-oxoglutarate dehydrogenase complex dihydrolipoamide dehydrogenase (E3) component